MRPSAESVTDEWMVLLVTSGYRNEWNETDGGMVLHEVGQIGQLSPRG